LQARAVRAYPTVFGGNTAAMVISNTTFSGGVTNVGTIGTGGIAADGHGGTLVTAAEQTPRPQLTRPHG
jgi:hypothetical protein